MQEQAGPSGRAQQMAGPSQPQNETARRPPRPDEQVPKFVKSLGAELEWVEALARLRNDHRSSHWKARLAHVKVGQSSLSHFAHLLSGLASSFHVSRKMILSSFPNLKTKELECKEE